MTTFDAAAAAVPGPDHDAAAAARARWDTRVKPPGSLGGVEDLAVRLASISGTCPPPAIEAPVVLVFAADHGVVAEGVTAWPSAITRLMAATVSSGGAAINAFARTVGAEVRLVDVGMLPGEPAAIPGLLDRRVAEGTANLAAEPAMTVPQLRSALDAGAAEASAAIDEGVDCLIGGELGIGNTTAAATTIAALVPIGERPIAGRGAGLAAADLPHKERVVRAAAERARAIPDPIERFAAVGGLEIAALAGSYVAAAARRCPVVVDGVIGAAALVAADALVPGTAAGCIAGHRSAEPAASIALAHLGLEPVIDLGLRLGEGTGAALAVPVLRAAVAALTDMDELPDVS
ncbi:MAG: nicotinate-nucleotide--dimethylbenzimidazole phosphoribosyltransferase [Actinomycetota bacterium]